MCTRTTHQLISVHVHGRHLCAHVPGPRSGAAHLNPRHGIIKANTRDAHRTEEYAAGTAQGPYYHIITRGLDYLSGAKK